MFFLCSQIVDYYQLSTGPIYDFYTHLKIIFHTSVVQKCSYQTLINHDLNCTLEFNSDLLVNYSVLDRNIKITQYLKVIKLGPRALIL